MTLSFRKETGNPIIFQWIEKLKEIVSETSNQNPLSGYISLDTFVQPSHASKQKVLNVIHGPIIVDRKSVFQGHACVVKNENDVK